MLTPPPKLHKIEKFDEFFDPVAYFEHYYSAHRVDEFEKESTPFLVKTLADVLKSVVNDFPVSFEHKKRLLQVGFSSAGMLLPILAEKHFDEIHIFEESAKCHDELIKWKFRPQESFDWQLVVDQINSKGLQVDRDVVRKLRNKVNPTVSLENDPFPESGSAFDFVATMFHLEPRCSSYAKYHESVKSVLERLDKNGFYLQAGMLNQSYYDGGKNQYFVSLSISKQEILDIIYDTGLAIKSWNDFEVPYCNASRTTTSPGASMYLCLAQKSDI